MTCLAIRMALLRPLLFYAVRRRAVRDCARGCVWLLLSQAFGRIVKIGSQPIFPSSPFGLTLFALLVRGFKSVVLFLGQARVNIGVSVPSKAETVDACYPLAQVRKTAGVAAFTIPLESVPGRGMHPPVFFFCLVVLLLSSPRHSCHPS